MNDWATRNINSFFSSTQVYQSPGQITFHAPKHVSVNLRGQKLQKAIKKKMLKLEINYKKKNWKKKQIGQWINQRGNQNLPQEK